MRILQIIVIIGFLAATLFTFQAKRYYNEAAQNYYEAINDHAKAIKRMAKKYLESECKK